MTSTITPSAHRPVERACYLIGVVLIVSGLAHLLVFAVDGGPWYGPVSWRKPVTFGVSFGLILAGVTWVASYLRLSERARTWLLGIFAADCVLEVTGITVQAWRRVPSHFNTETPFDTVVAMNLAVGGAVLIAVLGSLAVTAFRGRVDAAASMRLALRAGFALLLVGLATGAAMIARGEVLVKTGHRQQAYDTAGSLKLVHGVTLNAILVLPVLAWLLARTTRTEAQRLRAIGVATTGYALAAILALVISLN
ncbi:MAG: hypothetical protein ACR2JQ_02000 [Mycobacteriales bacterium]